MVDTKKIQESLPIELIQKDTVISDEEIDTNPTFTITVNNI